MQGRLPFVKSTYLTDLTTDVYCLFILHYSILRNNSLLTKQPAAHDNDFILLSNVDAILIQISCSKRRLILILKTVSIHQANSKCMALEARRFWGRQPSLKSVGSLESSAESGGCISLAQRAYVCTSRMYKGEGWMQNDKNFTAAHPGIKWAKVQTSVVPECGLT